MFEEVKTKNQPKHKLKRKKKQQLIVIWMQLPVNKYFKIIKIMVVLLSLKLKIRFILFFFGRGFLVWALLLRTLFLEIRCAGFNLTI